MSDDLRYLSGFGNMHVSEALPGAVPSPGNTPRRPPYGLYTEGINGTGFTVRRDENRKLWLYRIRPSMIHGVFSQIDQGLIVSDFSTAVPTPNIQRWRPLPIPTEGRVDFVDGLATVGGAGLRAHVSGLRHARLRRERVDG